jgi:hypothetical protein
LVLFDGAACRIDLLKETMTITAAINSEEEGEDDRRNLPPKEPYRRVGESERRWFSMRGLEERR